MSVPFMFVFLESDHVPSTTVPAPMPSYCLTSNGHRYEEGDSWHDGCRDCYCHSGREMCVLISCPVPNCSHPVVRPDQCCPTCEGMSLQFTRDFLSYPVSKGDSKLLQLVLAIVPIWDNSIVLTELTADIWELLKISLMGQETDHQTGLKQTPMLAKFNWKRKWRRFVKFV